MELPISRMALYGAIAVFVLTGVAVGLKIYIGEHPQPGTGPQAAEAFEMTAQILGALDRFDRDNSRYPKDLDEMAPKYIPKNPQKDERTPYKLSYFPNDEKHSFSLRFEYESPKGMVECNYFSDEKKWNCGMKQ
jgi:hypothetical protein